MAILGFFSRKSKSKASSSQASSSVVQDEAGSAEDYILSPPSAAVPSVANGDDGYTSSGASFVSAASSKKARLPFSKKSSAATSSPLARPYGPPRGLPDVSTDKLSLSLETSLNSLPTRTSVFPSFHGSNSSPTLTRLSVTDALDRPQPNPIQKKELPENLKSGGGLFAWRERKKSKPSKPEAETLPLPPLNDESFNLKAFRHVLPEPRPESPNGSFTQSSPMSLVPPARPRGGSMASTDSSQRISVAAFREAQARRSSTNLASGTPSPTIRPVSGIGSVSDVAPSRPPRAPRPPSSATTARDVKLLPSRPPTRASSSSSSSSSEESDSDDCSPSRSRSRLSRQLTITKQSYRAKSDLGHGAIPPDSSHHRQSTSTRSELGHGLPTSSKQPSPTNAPPPSSFQQTSDASVGTRSFSLYRRQQESHSTSELSPSAAAQRANVLMEANKRNVQAAPRQSLSSSDTSDSDSESDSSDNAPLSALKQVKGSGSSPRTNYSVSAMLRKPLIDLNLKSNPSSGKPVPADTGGADREKARLALISPTNINGRLSQLTAAAGLGEHRSTSASKSEANLSMVVIPKTSHTRNSSIAASPVSSGTVSPPLRTTSPETITPNARKLSFSPSSPLLSPEALQELTRTQTDDQRSTTPLVKVNKPSMESLSSTQDSSKLIPGGNASRPARTAPPQTITPSVRTSSLSYSSSSSGAAQSPSQADDLRPVPVWDRPGDNHGFRVVSRPQKSATSPPSLIGSTNDNHKPTQQQNVQTTNRRQAPPSSYGAVSRPQSSMPMLSTKPLLAPAQTDGTSSTSTSSASELSSSRVALTSQVPPRRPFANGGKRQDSPASSTGGSSNGKAPLTPMDGSDYFSPDVCGSNNDSPSGSSAGAIPPSAMKGARGHIKRASVTFQEPIDFDRDETIRGRRASQGLLKSEEQASAEERENKRRERRRSEAKAAIELGNVISGRGPIGDDDDDGDLVIKNGMVPHLNPMAASGAMNLSYNNMSMSWQQQGMVGMGGMNPMNGAAGMGMGINPQQFMVPPLMPGADQAYLAAHQQAMRIAKQAYQYAVAQQAMAAAADEWERGSSVSAFAAPGGMGAGVGRYGMSSMHAMNGMNGMWGNTGPMFTAGLRSMYAGSSIGGAASEVGWGGAASVYGEAFGPSMQTSARRSQVLSGNMRSSGVVAFPGSSQRSELAVQTGSSSRNAPRSRTKTAPSNTPLPAQHRHNRGPPSSWKVGS